MSPDEISLARARLRTEVRQIDARIRQIEREDQLFRRCGFGSEVHEIQLAALRAERQECVATLGELRSQSDRPSAARPGLGSWLLLPVALGAMVWRSARGRRRAARAAHPLSPPLRPS